MNFFNGVSFEMSPCNANMHCFRMVGQAGGASVFYVCRYMIVV